MTNKQIAQIISTEFGVACEGNERYLWWSVLAYKPDKQKLADLATRITERIIELDGVTTLTQDL